MEPKTPLRLPLAVIGPVDVGRLTRELVAVDDFLNQLVLRGDQPTLPRTSKLLEELAAENHLDLLVKPARHQLLEALRNLQRLAPVLHISFAADPSPVFLQKLMDYLRREINPLVLLRVGLQPSITAGCVVRTANSYFDLSLRRHFKDRRGKLIERLGAA